jgi:hypothetical protein
MDGRRGFENDQIKSGYERGIGKILCTQSYQRTQPYRLQSKATTERVWAVIMHSTMLLQRSKCGRSNSHSQRL